jgi:hypothetical protein
MRKKKEERIFLIKIWSLEPQLKPAAGADFVDKILEGQG